MAKHKTKFKNEAELVREAIRIGTIYMTKRGAGELTDADPASLKIRSIYTLLVHDQLVQPLAKGEENEPNMKHKLALWISRQLPTNHPLLKES